MNANQSLWIGISASIIGIGFAVKSLWLISKGYSTTLSWIDGITIPYGVPIQFGLSIFVIVLGLKLIHDSEKNKRQTKVTKSL